MPTGKSKFRRRGDTPFRQPCAGSLSHEALLMCKSARALASTEIGKRAVRREIGVYDSATRMPGFLWTEVEEAMSLIEEHECSNSTTGSNVVREDKIVLTLAALCSLWFGH